MPASSARLRVILYHHLTDRPCRFVDRLGVSTPPEMFAAHLRWLAGRYDFVSLDQVLTGDLPHRPLLITFDDGYRSVLDVAAPLLRDHGAPSVFFISERIVAGPDLPLDNLLCHLTHEFGLAELETTITGNPARCETLGALFAGPIAALPWARRCVLADELAERFAVDRRARRTEANLFLRPDELASLGAYGIEVGNHTRSHLHCRCLDEAAAQEEIVDHRETLERLIDRPVRSFSFPYGSTEDATPIADRALRRSGHEAVFLVEARPNPRGHRGPYWHRVSMQAQPASELRRRIEWLPRLRAARDRMTGRRDMLHGHNGEITTDAAR